MSVRPGQAPIKAFQRHLIGWLLKIGLAALIPVLVGARWGRPGVLIAMFGSIIAAWTVVLYQTLHPCRCPACGGEARMDPESCRHWRGRFPYGWATKCAGCGLDLTPRWQPPASDGGRA